MKKVLLIVLLALIGKAVFAQEAVEPDARIYARFSEAQVQEWMENNPRQIAFMNYELRESFTLIEMADEKLIGLPELCLINEDGTSGESVDNVDSQSFNLYQYYYQRKSDACSYYRVGNSNLVLIVFPEEALVLKFNESYSHE
jgi:hypothetical protein